MLTSLRVKNLALVESVRLDLRAGLNVITGETGAGKSILLGALSLLLGERADRKFIREGEDVCSAEAVFALADAKPVNAILEEAGLAPCDDGQLIIRRIVKANGSSQNLVNDSAVTLNLLKALGERLVDMHGPHDHQSLLRPSFQLDLLDAYGHTEHERAAYSEIWERKIQLDARLDELRGDTTDVDAQLDLLRHRIREIDEADPKEGEEESVLREHAIVSNSQRVLELGGAAAAALADGENSAFDSLAIAHKNLEELARILPDAEIWREETRKAAAQIQELSASVASMLARIEGDPARLDWLDARIATYKKLKKKYGDSVTFEDDRLAHVKTEFSFDVLEVAKERYAPEGYHDFIGFEVAPELLERAFRETYGLELKTVLLNQEKALTSYRRAVSKLLPKVTRIAWHLKKDEIKDDVPGITKRKFLYNLKKSNFEREWGKEYKKPSAAEKFLAFLYRLLPKFGPLKVLEFKTPTPETERVFEESFNTTMDKYRELLRQEIAGNPTLPNDNFDVGGATGPGKYKLNDETHARLLGKLAEGKFAGLPLETREELIEFFAVAEAPYATKTDQKAWAKVQAELGRLKALGSAAAHPSMD